jgi:hypothetical protein
MRRRTPAVVIAVLLVTTLPASPEPAVRLVDIYGGLMAVELPDDWQEIDPLHLEELTMWSAEATAGRSVEVYQHGFRPQDPGADPSLPHILVQIRESGRLRYGRFLHLRPLDDIQDETHRSFPNGIPPLVMGVAVEGVSFNPATYCLRLEHSLDLRFKGRVTVLTAAFLTERGLVTFHFVDRERRINDGRVLFDRIIGSLRIAPEISYQPRTSDHLPGLPFFVAAAIVAAALMVFLLLRRRSRP